VGLDAIPTYVHYTGVYGIAGAFAAFPLNQSLNGFFSRNLVRNVFTATPKGKMKEVAAMLKAIHAQEDRAAAQIKVEQVAKKLETMKLKKAAQLVRDGAPETLSYMAFPHEYWLRIRTNNPLERVMKEIRRRTRVVGAFPDGQSALMLVAARLRHIAGTRWGSKMYLNIERLCETEREREIMT